MAYNPEAPKFTTSDLQTIIARPEGAQTLVRITDQWGKYLKDIGLTTSQIRALFGEVRQIQAQWSQLGAAPDAARARQKLVRRLILLKPKMAYRAKKERGKAVEQLVSILNPALDIVINEQDPARQDEYFDHFVEFFEAILAYHKAHGGN